MSRFFEIELTSLRFNDIPDNFFDVILMSHVIEHLPNGDDVLSGLIPKLKKKGVVYIEFPSTRSTKLPSMRDTLNFYDDPTHCRLYSISELSQVLIDRGCIVVNSGARRDWMRIMLFPFHLVYAKAKLGYVPGGVFWDLLGFADFIYAERG
jgi:SAM-dependent methyltransferase